MDSFWKNRVGKIYRIEGNYFLIGNDLSTVPPIISLNTESVKYSTGPDSNDYHIIRGFGDHCFLGEENMRYIEDNGGEIVLDGIKFCELIPWLAEQVKKHDSTI